MEDEEGLCLGNTRGEGERMGASNATTESFWSIVTSQKRKMFRDLKLASQAFFACSPIFLSLNNTSNA